MRCLCLAGAVTFGICCCSLSYQAIVSADTSPVATSAPDNSQIQQWIDDLNSSQYAVRAQAKQNLLATGDAALPLLQAQLKSLASVEQTADIDAILSAINQNDLLRGPLVSLDADAMPADQAFKTVLDQAKVTYSIWPPQLFSTQYQPIPPATLHVHSAPYWQVMWALYQQTGVGLNYFNNGLQLTNNLSLDKHNPINIHGAFAIVLQSIQYHRDVNFNSSNPTVDQSFNIQMQLLAVPNLPLVQSNSNNDVELTTAVDDKGQSLLLSPGMPPNQPQYWYNNQPNTQMNISADLNRIRGIGRQLSLLQGYVPVRIECDKQDLTISDLTKPGQTLAIEGDSGIVITFQGFTNQGNNNYQIKYTITWPVNNNQVNNNMLNFNGINGIRNTESQQMQFLTSQLQSWSSVSLLDSSGQQLQFQGGGGGGGNGRMSYSYNYGQNNNVGPPAKLVFTIYCKLLDTKVPFEFKDVPLP